ncbi:CMD domain protein [Microbacterium azadirachtae]|uniref:CMD domain protein n=1 Tax=Microbacterium azadirachtae TaxID=582680 RepID=UPI0008888663|nr:CMD domain protein [Microbacterium azadirachtae]SDL70599.1 CMD domain protein, Avi_7170 family [Microbacterium azadirachtae]SEG00247.1 CMD domain protein, Avi_7170 family [Microbacterium azadirachtae]SEG02561.1 CMD domain protein, Avi_7170 family [Microbacterium azadirachtae]
MSDLIDDLVGIVPGSTLDALRAKRPVARSDAQATYDGLITTPADLARARSAERAALGYWVAALSRAGGLAEHYRALLDDADPEARAAIDAALPGALTTGPYGAYPEGPLSVEDEEGLHWIAPTALRDAIGSRLSAALEHAHLLTYRPRDASPDALQTLLDAGWSTDGVVTVSQLVAFTHFQLRVIAGLSVLKEAI